MVAAAIVAVGLTAAAVLASTLMQQQELNAAALRAANLQEQAVRLFRLDLSPSEIVAILPERCSRVAVGSFPSDGGYGFSFSRAAPMMLSNGSGSIMVEATTCQMVYESLAEVNRFATNVVSIVRPSIRVQYNQN